MTKNDPPWRNDAFSLPFWPKNQSRARPKTKSVMSIGSFAFDKCPNLTIYGYPGSAAEEHAKDYEIPFVKIEELINIKKATVSVIKSKTYTGKKLSQSLRVVLNGAVLQKNVDR